jgi:hypothetical protein
MALTVDTGLAFLQLLFLLKLSEILTAFTRLTDKNKYGFEQGSRKVQD